MQRRPRRNNSNPHFLFTKENRRLIGEKKTFGGLSEYKIPQSLYAGVVFADDAENFVSLYRTAGIFIKFASAGHSTCPLNLHTRITPLLPHIGVQ